jgi:hypothetical protein
VGAEFPEKGAKELPRGELSSQKEIREESKQRSEKNKLTLIIKNYEN